jgi:hypothetical protein
VRDSRGAEVGWHVGSRPVAVTAVHLLQRIMCACHSGGCCGRACQREKLEKYDKVKDTTFFSELRQGGDAKAIYDYIRQKDIWFGSFPCRCQWASFMPGVKIRQ